MTAEAACALRKTAERATSSSGLNVLRSSGEPHWQNPLPKRAANSSLASRVQPRHRKSCAKYSRKTQWYMTERDIKLLWGRSGNRCAICKAELSQDRKLSSDKYPLGEQAHIIGEKESAARGRSNLTEQERDGYANRILLCPNHHTEIDRDEQFYSVERIHLIKQEHELWVQEKLSEWAENTQADGLVYSALIDAAVENCCFTYWNKWVPSADGGAFGEWPESIITGIADFHDRVLRAAWPGTRTELEQALKTLAITLFKARERFLLHAEYQHLRKIYTGVSFYNRTWHQQSVYDRLLKQYNRWCMEYAFGLLRIDGRRIGSTMNQPAHDTNIR